ncbi:MAG TPA: hypothetical protein VMT85_12220 [Thermoanaerobaculia bacterium]|nr:hypothetical protein [Thermoanaerobaculia bacterium]
MAPHARQTSRQPGRAGRRRASLRALASSAIALALIAAGASARPAHAGRSAEELTWHEHYELALRAIEERQAAPAIAHLEKALAQRPVPELRAPTSGVRYVDYLPYAYLAVAHYLAGDLEASRANLERSKRAGAVLGSDEGARLVSAYDTLLEKRAIGSGSERTGAQRSFREYDPPPPTLSEQEAERIRNEVAMRCGVTRASNRLPWYYYYELGLALRSRGDSSRALEALIEATDRRPVPKQRAFMYGMWFIDYLPYFEIAKLHRELGNLECARDALLLSEAYGEAGTSKEIQVDLQELKRDLETLLFEAPPDGR